MRVRMTEEGASLLKALGLAGPGELLSGGMGTPVRETPHRRTLRIPLPGGGGGGACFLKLYAPGAGRIGKVAGGRAPAAVEWEAARELIREGIPVPEPRAAVWGGRGDREPSAFLMAGVEGGIPLDLFMDGAEWDPGWEGWLLDSFLPVVRRLHERGFQHRDLYACHFLVGKRGDPPVLIDLARVRRQRLLSTRRRVKDLAALHLSLVPRLRPSLLLRLFDAYLGGGMPGDRRRRLLLRVLRKSARMAGHRPKYDSPVKAAFPDR